MTENTSYYDRKLGQWKKDKWTKTIRNTGRRGVTESLLEERPQFGVNKWCKGLFEGHGENMEGDQSQPDQNWRPNTPTKWDPGYDDDG
jgi:hypothetical protein